MGSKRATGTPARPDRSEARLLGGFSLTLDGRPVPPLDSIRAESVLAYLLLHRDAPVPRQRLAFALWPDSTDAQAMTNLRHVLHTLRRSIPALDDYLDVGPRTLRWRPERPLLLDVEAFEQAVEARRLQEAVDRYHGELLEGCYDEWVREPREQLSRHYRDALAHRAQQLARSTQLKQAISLTERLVAVDPLREDAHRLLIRLCARAGDRPAAVRAYHVCVATLQRELGVGPSRETRETYGRLLRQPSADEADRPRPHRSPPRPPLVGRVAERRTLNALWRAVGEEGPRLVLVTGEPGVGKTRLAEELRSWCAQQGAVTAEARSYEGEGAMALALVAAWLRTDPIADQVRDLPPHDLVELARIVPDLLATAAGLPHPEPLPASAQRRRLFTALARALLPRGRRLLLVADDLQWCDLESLHFLHFLLRARPDDRLLLLATARREDLEPSDPVHQLIASAQRWGRYSEVELGRLTRAETRMLAEGTTGMPLDEDQAERLFSASEGNPLFVIEAASAGTRSSGTDADGDAAARVRGVISSRLAKLSPAASEVAAVAATIGREFSADLLSRATGHADRDVVVALDELWRRGIVRAQGIDGYDFTHGRIRDAAYEAIGPALRRQYHLDVAHALAADARGDELSGPIAGHYHRAGQPHDALSWYERAAEAAQRVHASDDAVRFLDRALEVAGQLPVAPHRDEAMLRLLTALPAPLVSRQGYLSPRVAQVHADALALAEKLGRDLEPPLTRSVAMAHLTRGSFAAARPYAEQLRQAAERDNDNVLWVESAYVLGVTSFWQGRLRDALHHFRSAVARFRPEQRTAHLLRYGQDPLAFCLMRLAYTSWLLGRTVTGDHLREQALALAEESAHPFTLASAHGWAVLLALDADDETALRHHVDALLSHDRDDLPRPVRLIAEAGQGYVDVLDGRAPSGLHRLEGAVASALDETPGAPGGLGMLMRVALAAYDVADRPRRGLELSAEALRAGQGVQLWEPEVRRLRGGFLQRSGAASEEVEAELVRAVEVARRHGARTFEERAAAALTRLHSRSHGRNARGTAAPRT